LEPDQKRPLWGLLKKLGQVTARSGLKVRVSIMAQIMKRAAAANFLRFIAIAVSRAWIFMFSRPRRAALFNPWSGRHCRAIG